MPKNKLIVGKDARTSIPLKYLHPSKLVSETIINPTNNQRLDNCLVVRRADFKIRGNVRSCIVVHHESFKNDDGFVDLYCAEKWCRVTEEGPSELFFNVQQAAEQTGVVEAEEQMPAVVLEAAARGGAISLADLSSVVDVDDDNMPAPENIPTPNNNNGISAIYEEEWGHSGVCYRRMLNSQQTKASLRNFPHDVLPTSLQLLEIFFPVSFIKEVMLPTMNTTIEEKITYGEFLKWLGLWFFMATTQFQSRRDFWSIKPISMFDGAPYRFNDIMSRNRFESILSALQFTNLQPPTYKDRFWEVRQLIDAWNLNMTDKFSPSWISCLDESMSKWLDQWTCPGFIVCPRKPWPYGNEYHTISCGESQIIYAVDLVEGKDEPRQQPKKYAEHGKTVGVMLRLSEPLFHTSKVVVCDSGFCVLKGIIEMRKHGVFCQALVKKRRYWPKYVNGDHIAKHFESKDVGSVDALSGMMDGHSFHLYGLKEPDYVMTIMSTYGTLQRVGADRQRTYQNENGENQSCSFAYPELVFNHFNYRDAVDANNRDRMFPVALEETWKTTRWPCRVFQFLLAVSEVNVRRAMHRIFAMDDLSQQDFRKRLGRELIENPYLEVLTTPLLSLRPRQRICEHRMLSIPAWHTFDKTGKLVKSKTQYIQRKCKYCRNVRNSYCSCTPGVVICRECFGLHLEDHISPRQLDR